MSTIALEPELLEQLREIAGREEVGDLIREAVRIYLDRVAREKIRAETRAFYEVYEQLRQQYLGEYVALHNGKVVDHDVDLHTLHQRVRRRYRHVPVLIRQVTEKPEWEIAFRSPRLEGWS